MTGHTYPSRYGRGVDKKLDEVWDILDVIRPGVIPEDVRAYLAGAMLGLVAKSLCEEALKPREPRSVRIDDGIARQPPDVTSGSMPA